MPELTLTLIPMARVLATMNLGDSPLGVTLRWKVQCLLIRKATTPPAIKPTALATGTGVLKCSNKK